MSVISRPLFTHRSQRSVENDTSESFFSQDNIDGSWSLHHKVLNTRPVIYNSEHPWQQELVTSSSKLPIEDDIRSALYEGLHDQQHLHRTHSIFAPQPRRPFHVKTTKRWETQHSSIHSLDCNSLPFVEPSIVEVDNSMLGGTSSLQCRTNFTYENQNLDCVHPSDFGIHPSRRPNELSAPQLHQCYSYKVDANLVGGDRYNLHHNSSVESSGRIMADIVPKIYTNIFVQISPNMTKTSREKENTKKRQEVSCDHESAAHSKACHDEAPQDLSRYHRLRQKLKSKTQSALRRSASGSVNKFGDQQLSAGAAIKNKPDYEMLLFGLDASSTEELTYEDSLVEQDLWS